MNINPSILLEKLKEYQITYEPEADDAFPALSGVRVLGGGDQDYSQRYVYVGTVSTANKLDHLNKDCVFCLLKDCGQFNREGQGLKVIYFSEIYELEDIVNDLTDIFHAFDTWEKDLTRLLTVESELQAFIDVSDELVGYAISILDYSKKTMAFSNRKNDDPAWIAISTGYITESHQSREVISFERIAHHSGPVQQYSTVSERWVLTSALRVNEHPVATLGFHMAAKGDKRFRNGAYHIMRILITFLEKKLILNPFEFTIHGYPHEHLLKDLIEDNYSGKEQILERMHVLGIHFNAPYKIVLIRPLVDSLTFYDHLHQDIEKDFSETISIYYERNYVCFSQNTDDVRCFSEFMNQNHGFCAVSNDFDDISKARICYLETLFTLQYGINNNLNNELLFFKDYVWEFSAKVLADSCDSDLFIGDAVNRLRNYSNENGSTLLESLRVYLLLGCNITDAAKELNIHRNTMINRISKIKEIMQCDVEDLRYRMPLIFQVQIILMDSLRTC